MINYIYNSLFKRHDDDILFWKQFWTEKNKIYKETGKTDLDVFSSKRYYQILFKDIQKYIGTDFKAKKIMELGSGSGILSILMAAQGAEVYLVDISSESLKYAQILETKLRKNLPEFSGGITYLQKNFDEVLSDKSLESVFDLVHNEGIIEEYSRNDAMSIISGMKKLTRPGGIIMVGVPNFLNPYLIKLWVKNGKGNELFFSKKRLGMLCAQAGLLNVFVFTSSYVYPFKKFRWAEGLLGRVGFGFLHLAISKNEASSVPAQYATP